jgi:hypothetical protein
MVYSIVGLNVYELFAESSLLRAQIRDTAHTLAFWGSLVRNVSVSLEMATSSLRGAVERSAEWRVVVHRAMQCRHALSSRHHV